MITLTEQQSRQKIGQLIQLQRHEADNYREHVKTTLKLVKLSIIQKMIVQAIMNEDMEERYRLIKRRTEISAQ
jgi:uncharacterized protein YfkK (UPF0435 family)